MDEDSLLRKRNKAQKDGNVQVLADVEKKLGDLYFDKKHYDDALEAYKGQLEACKCSGDKLNCAIAHRMIGEVYADIAQFEEALKHQNLYLDIAKELNDLIEEQRAYATLGRTYLLVSDSLKESENDKKMETLREAKKAFSKSIKLCDKLEKKINVSELMMMRARLLLNLGLVLEQQKDTEQALTLIKQAATLCKKYNLSEDLYRTNIALGGIHERLGKTDLAFKNLDDAIKVDDIYLKAEARLLKAELLLRLGEWMEAQKILHNLYKSKRLLEPLKQQVSKVLRIAIVLCKTEDKLLIEDNLSEKEKLYEKMGDAAIAVRSLSKAAEYYQNMLFCAEQTKSNQLGAALTSLFQTLRDDGKFGEAVPYARRELDLCKDPKDTCNSALYLAGLLNDANASDTEIREMFHLALTSAEKCSNLSLQRLVIKDFIEYLRKKEAVDVSEITLLNEKLENLPNSVSDEESEDELESPDIGADVCLDELSDEDAKEKQVFQEKTFSKTTRRIRCIVKRNEKGESQLHVACIKGNIVQVERLLEEQHPTDVRDHCGWTPLHEAANHGFVEIVKLLIRAGADVNDPGGSKCDGVTALHDAAANGHMDIVHLLLDNGADANLLTRKGESALDCLEQWRKRVELSANEIKEYAHAKHRLAGLITIKKSKSKKRRDEEPGWSALIDDDDDKNESELRPIDTWTKTEPISAGEDYKRTIASLQHPGRINLPTKQPKLPKITAPLIDSEEMLVDEEDWLDDDLGIRKRKEKTHFGEVNLPAAVPSTKRKSKNDSDQEIDKTTKRQKVCLSFTRNAKATTPTKSVNENSWDGFDNDLIFEPFNNDDNWPKKKKPRQTNLLKQGFTKVACSNSPSTSPSPEPLITDISQNIRKEHERHSWDSGCISETLDLEILVDEESFELKLHFRDLKKSMSNIEELIRHKFETKTGCKPKMKFKTTDGVVLAAEVTLEEVPKNKNKLKLIGEITENNLPSIVNRYKKVCETFSVDATDSMLKSLRSCDYTSTFRLGANESVVEELEPLMRCLRYQENLQTLNLSGATFFGCGELLNRVVPRLSGLYELHLLCCDINFECLDKIDKLPVQLRILDLSYNPLGSQSQKKLYDLLEPLKYLQTLNLRSCNLDDFKFTYSNHSLVNLDISWNPIGGQGAANLIQGQLLNLNLSNTQNFSCNRINIIDKIFFNDFPSFSFITLESLELNSCEATDLDVEKILSKTPNLTRISINNNINVTITSLRALLARKPTMNYIDVSGCRIIDQSPDINLKIVNPQVCSLIVHMKLDVTDSWEKLWQGKGYAKKFPHSLVLFKPI